MTWSYRNLRQRQHAVDKSSLVNADLERCERACLLVVVVVTRINQSSLT